MNIMLNWNIRSTSKKKMIDNTLSLDISQFGNNSQTIRFKILRNGGVKTKLLVKIAFLCNIDVYYKF